MLALNINITEHTITNYSNKSFNIQFLPNTTSIDEFTYFRSLSIITLNLQSLIPNVTYQLLSNRRTSYGYEYIVYGSPKAAQKHISAKQKPVRVERKLIEAERKPIRVKLKLRRAELKPRRVKLKLI